MTETPASGRRKWLRLALGLAGVAFAVHVLLPQVKELPGAIHQAEAGSYWWLVAAIVTSLVSYLGASVSLQGSLEATIPFWPATETQLATSFTGLMAPQGVGALTTNLHFLQRQRVPQATAATAVGLNGVAGVIVHVISLVLAVLLFGHSLVSGIRVPPRWELLAAVGAFGLVAGVVVWSPLGQHRLLPAVRSAARSLGATLRRPVRFAQLFGGSALITFSNALTLAFVLDAFGSSIPTSSVIAVYLVAAAIASIAPTPGGLGALEAALVAGLTAVGVVASAAVAGVLVFRLLTFWAPIIPGVWALRRLRNRGLI
jgi:uncharacterized membrane protein YbhN (UPF0104 family)